MHSKLRWQMTVGMLLFLATPEVVILRLSAQSESVARQWNEVLLEAIRNDFARPTVHARNLFHVSAAVYDAWAAYHGQATPYLLGRQVGSYICPFDKSLTSPPAVRAQEEALSYAAYRLILHRFALSPGRETTFGNALRLLRSLGFDPEVNTTDYRDGSPAALGNYIAARYIEFGLQDGSNEQNRYANRYYQPVNSGLDPYLSGSGDLKDPDRWQPLRLPIFIDQSGQELGGGDIPFLSPEWGNVTPFSLKPAQKSVFHRSGNPYTVYLDPGPPAFLSADPEAYRWNFALVAAWSSHLDPADSVWWDISPASIGNTENWPTTFAEYQRFYNLEEGRVSSSGHAVNPKTGLPYEPQWVPRGDYTRVLAEFWADGPDSETPPGHWYKIFNQVSDHPDLVKRLGGQGPVVSDLEWDVKCYFALGGALHDAAIAAWSIKGWYDYVRPVSAIRYMGAAGQSSDPNLPNYHPHGLPLIPGLIEQIGPSDWLATGRPERIGQLKLLAWRGPTAIQFPQSQRAGVSWVLATEWWPYQRPTFVTPPFAGFISGHSTFSRAAAEALTILTGDPYFPGGLGVFPVRKNQYLVFENGPSRDFELQWATYRDASDECSLSRIWGGIHPPIDDIPGREIGLQIGQQAMGLAWQFFNGEIPTPDFSQKAKVFPNPVSSGGWLSVLIQQPTDYLKIEIIDLQGRVWRKKLAETRGPLAFSQIELEGLPAGIYLTRLTGEGWTETVKVVIQ